MLKTIPQSVLDQYDIGEVVSVKVNNTGLIHQTFEVQTKQGQYIMQSLHDLLSTKEIANDFFAVTEYLTERGFPVPKCVRSKDGLINVEEDGVTWRMQTKLDGIIFSELPSAAHAKSAAALFGKFHRELLDFDYEFQSKLILHKTKEIYEEFVRVVNDKANADPRKEAEEEIKIITENLPEYFINDATPKRVIHGDPKISNVMFNENGEAIAIIDLDTCNRGFVGAELGDAIRSWCGGKEDDPENTFDEDILNAILEGYLANTDEFLSVVEKDQFTKCGGTIMLELACRFLTDYFKDEYFGWDEAHYSSRREHNLARCRGQLAEFKSFIS